MTKEKIIKQIPNIITSTRIIGTIAVLFLAPVLGFGLTALSLACLALTDKLDGVLAKKLDAKSELGAKLDAIADKLFAVVTILSIVELGSVYSLALLFPVAFEVAIGSLNLAKALKGIKPQTIFKGKIKTWSLDILVISSFLQLELSFLSHLVEGLLATTLATQLITFMGYINQEEELEKDEKIYKKISELKEHIKEKNYKEKKLNLEKVNNREKEKEFLQSKKYTKEDYINLRKTYIEEENTKNIQKTIKK